MGKQKLDAALKQKLTEGKKLFVPYIMAGDGGLDILPERIQFLEDSGVAAIELGIPFSDPVADGPTIQQAGLRALENGTTLKSVLEILKKDKETRTVPIILMTYMNPIYAYGIQKFFDDCHASGVDGIIVPDVPMEEEHILSEEAERTEIAFIRLAALTSTEERLANLAQRSEGFLYAVSVTGTTGKRSEYVNHIGTYLSSLKSQSNVPVLAGFGVSTSEQARELGSACDGVIVGSTIVQLFHEGKDDAVRKLIQESI